MRSDWSFDWGDGAATPNARELPSELAGLASDLRRWGPDLSPHRAEFPRLERLMREAGDDGVTRHRLAADLALPLEVVDHVLAGGTIDGFAEGRRASG